MYTFPLPNIYYISTCLQLVCNCISILKLKFKDIKFKWETFKQVTHCNISTNVPQCINDLHVLMFMGFSFALGGWRFLFFLLKRLKAFVFTLGGRRFLFLFLERLKVFDFAFKCSNFLLFLLNVEGSCSYFWMLKVLTFIFWC